MTYQFYKIMHFLGLMTLFFGLGGLLVASYAKVTLTKQARIMTFVTHGLGLMLLLIGGFGMMAKLGIMAAMPGWLYGKLIIWMLLGLAVSLVKRKGYIGWPIAILLLVLGTTASIFAINKPF
ncbi:hypothetical protein AB1A81_04395 [Bdellovibrio bacteriovorus]|uniref:Uncharacterized protein n=1 Tax=Bdellovibrio bacteriovorus (strain ATCC 15356 / DSM 50701 / NCIMB 9529 / HD100) TaxID=264462 RepID=Q6MPA9_BDEBA|nr:hypothetical protein [Bdellovibrio bacteriovorus]AHZ86205.1 hypothetical protein EP01_14870 [Bdellovibrio bacteriovorus]BEV67441.1 hypothetical protein Bb109J_c0861 [Bdellovibrio bacteriovorus]CAE78889.1 hypothetical protein predicted by Glimmer/Critica [Bdellovibrio bacteriovorus HD100]